ncbi:hypothetical protein FB451DRAFT_1389924 [Mycena latifolia]|nr:hypothetical protein FB451DRAFT_1389924 [Mycena latifolia]
MTLLASPVPQELIDIIVDDIQDDSATLKICSYVSPAFRRSSQRHIFSRIRLLPPWSANRPIPCKKFYELLLSAPHLASYVRFLEIIEGDGRGARHISWIASDRTLELVLPLLQLRRLSLHCTWPNSLNAYSLPGPLKEQLHNVLHSPTLTSLSLGRMLFAPSDFHFLLGSCAGLKELTLSNVSVHSALDVDDPKTTEPDAHRAQLESLVVVESNGEIIELLLSPQSPVDLRSLHTLSIYGYLDPPHLEGLIQRPCATLQHLSVWDALRAEMNLGFFTADHKDMRSLCIAPSDLTAHLFRNCSPRLERITIELSLANFVVVSELAWKDLANVLTRSELTHLREVTVKVCPLPDAQHWTLHSEAVFLKCTVNAKNSLSALAARVVLEVVRIPS